MIDSPKITHPETKEILTPAKLFGVVDPLSTPFLPIDGHSRVDIESLGKEVCSVLPYVDALFPMGNAGEGPQIDFWNWMVIINTVVRTRDAFSRNHIPVLAGVLRSDVDETHLFSGVAQELGADGIIVAPMMGEKPGEILNTVLSSCDLPVILYNNPSMTKKNELPVEFVHWAKDTFPNRVIGIKSSTDDLQIFYQLLELKSDSFKVFQGNTKYDVVSLLAGADGIVSAESSIYPETLRRSYDSIKESGKDAAEKISSGITDMLADLKSRRSPGETFIHPIKAELVAQGIFKSSRMYKE